MAKSKREEQRDFDIICVGAGIGALAASAIQARRGKSVLVLERHSSLGGYATMFGRTGASFDVSLHQIGGVRRTGVRRIFELAGVYEKVTFLKDPYLSELHIGETDEIIRIPNGDPDAYIAQLVERFPKEKAAIKLWFWVMRRFGRQIARFDRMRTISNPLAQGLGLFLAPVLIPFLVVSSFFMPVLSRVMRAKDPILSSILLHFDGYYGLSADRLNMLFPMAANYGYIYDGGYYVEGGGYALSRAFSRVIRRNGGQLANHTEVEQIMTEKGRVTGVRVKGDERPYFAPEIICGANPVTVCRDMLPDSAATRSELAKYQSMELSMSASVLYMRLDVPIGALNPQLEKAYEFVSLPDLDDKSFFDFFLTRDGFEGGYDDHPVTLSIHSNIDPSCLGDERTGTLLDVFFCDNFARWASLSENEYAVQKVKEVDKMLDRLEQLLPGLRNHIVISELGTPLTMKRYINNEDGALYGFAQTPKQSVRKRPSKSTSVKGLHYVSAWANPGGGYEGSLRAAMHYTHPIPKASIIVAVVLIILSIVGPNLHLLF